MSACFSKSCGGLSSSLNMKEEEAMVTRKHGIVSILGNFSEVSPNSSASALRRTLSADMSSKNWFEQNWVYPMKTISSSLELYDPSAPEDSISSTSSEKREVEGKDEDLTSGFDNWASIHENRDKDEDAERPGQIDIWNSILSQKAKEDLFIPPYVHPLVKRSTSSLSEKSLEICTESLGSESGSDGFSFYQPSKAGDRAEGEKEEDKEEATIERLDAEQERFIPKYNYLPGKKLPPRSLPPPIPSLSRKGGTSMQMRTHRHNGRLVLKATTVPSQSNFQAERQDGRLVLTFSAADCDAKEERRNAKEGKIEPEKREEELERPEEEADDSERCDNEETEHEQTKSRIDLFLEPKVKPSSWLMNFHRLAGMISKPTVLDHRGNPTWPAEKQFNRTLKPKETEEGLMEPRAAKAHSMPPRPRAAITLLLPAAAADAMAATVVSFNAYECYRWPRPVVARGSVPHGLSFKAQSPPNNTSKMRSKNTESGVDDLVNWFKGCKEQRSSLMFGEAYCIAT